MPDPRTINLPGSGTATQQYELAPGLIQYVQSVRVVVDNTAGADATPTLSVSEQSGVVIADVPQNGVIPAGEADGAATWALRLTDDTRASTGSGIQFDTDNEGGWLDVTVNDTDANGYGFDLKNASAGPMLIESPGGDLRIEGAEGNVAHLDANGSITIETDGGASVPDIDIDSVGTLTLEGDSEVRVLAAGFTAEQVIIDSSGTTVYLLPDADTAGLFVRDGSGIGQFVFIVQHNFEGVGDVLTVRDTAGNDLFQVRDDGTLHGQTGGSLVFDL